LFGAAKRHSESRLLTADRGLPNDVVVGNLALGQSVGGGLYTVGMARDSVHQLLATDLALDKLGARGISAEEAEQLARNAHVIV
jgi:hypothetical protein